MGAQDKAVATVGAAATTTAAEAAAPADGENASFVGGYLPSMPGHHHDIPLTGIFSSAFEDAFGAGHEEEDLRAAFDRIDTDKSGKLDKTEISSALRDMGKSERQIQKVINAMPKGVEELDFDGFKTLMVPPERDAVTNYTVPGIGAEVPVPNHEKILDVPVLGSTLSATGDIIASPIDHVLRSSWRYWHQTNDDKLQHTFDELDVDKDGSLDSKEIARGLRKWGYTEAEISDCVQDITKPLSLYEFKKLIRGQKFQQHGVNWVPLGSVVTHNVMGHHDWDEDDLKEAWEFMDKGKKGKMNKLELGDLMRELGLSEFQIQRVIDFMEPGVHDLDFAGFKELLAAEEERPYTTTVKGIPVPNPAKIHDVPLIGIATSTAQDTLTTTYAWTIGAAVNKFSGGPAEEDLKAAFDAQKPKKGKISGDFIARAMREAGKTEVQIKAQSDEMGGFGKAQLTFDQFKEIVG